MINPCGHRLVVKPFKQAEIDEISKEHLEFLKTLTIAGGNTAREDQSVDQGIVLAIGPTAWKNDSMGHEPWCKIGDTILFAKFGGKFITDPDTNELVCVMNDEDVVAVIKETSNV